jgi:hypothetical protein
MTGSARAYRIVDGERVEGTWRSVFVHNGDFHLADLVVYADGVIDCWGEITLDELREHLRTGWVTLRPEAGAIGDAGFARWQFTEPRSWMTADDLVAEVADEIERLAGRPTAADRCLATLDRYRLDPSEDNRLALRAAYLEVPEHLRQYLCFDMDGKDWPIRVLITDLGAPVHGAPADGDEDYLVTAEWRADALRYFAGRERIAAGLDVRDTADGPAAPRSATVSLVRGGDGNFGPQAGQEVRALAVAARRRDGWADARTAVMAALLRAKFAQHPPLAEALLATGDGRIDYAFGESDFWNTDERGRGWLGRLLELIRAELVAERNGLTF